MGKRRRQVISMFAPTYGPSRPPVLYPDRSLVRGGHRKRPAGDEAASISLVQPGRLSYCFSSE
jgi:hypothetical protein